MSALLNAFMDLMHKGGPVMWPLLACSVIGLMLSFERMWFWLRTNGPASADRVQRLGQTLRSGNVQLARQFIDRDSSVYGRVVAALLREKGSDAAAVAAVDAQRPRMERFMGTLSTIITAAPMLGILGTVTGLIQAFNILSDEGVSDPRAISPAVAEALITTAAGLVIAIGVLFPYNAFRAQLDRTLSRIESLIAAVNEGQEKNVPAAGETPAQPKSI